MKSEPIVEIIERTRWTCGVDGHAHLSRSVAEACISRQERRAANTPKRVSDELKRAMFRAVVIDGTAYSKAGRLAGVSGARCADIVQRVSQILSWSIPELDKAARDMGVLNIGKMRQHKEFWARHIDAYRTPSTKFWADLKVAEQGPDYLPRRHDIYRDLLRQDATRGSADLDTH